MQVISDSYNQNYIVLGEKYVECQIFTEYDIKKLIKNSIVKSGKTTGIWNIQIHCSYSQLIDIVDTLDFTKGDCFVKLIGDENYNNWAGYNINLHKINSWPDTEENLRVDNSMPMI